MAVPVVVNIMARLETLEAMKLEMRRPTSIKNQYVPAAKPATPKPVSKTGFYFGDKVTKAPADTTKTKKPKAAAKKKKFDLEDEYYDLEGF